MTLTSPPQCSHIAGPMAGGRDLDIFNLAQATKFTGVSDTTLMKLIKAKLLPAAQVAPYTPLEIKGRDLDREPVASILEHLRMTGRLVLTGDLSVAQRLTHHGRISGE